MDKIKAILNWFGTGIQGIANIIAETPSMMLPFVAVLWMCFRMIDVMFGFSTDFSSYEVIMMAMTVIILLNTESIKNKK
jgi:hypothetical protein